MLLLITLVSNVCTRAYVSYPSRYDTASQHGSDQSRSSRACQIRCCPLIACMNTNGEREHLLYSPETWHTVRIRRMQWSSRHATVPIHSAPITASAASVFIW